MPAHTGSIADAAPAPIHSQVLDAVRGVAMLLVYAFHVDLMVMSRFWTPAGTEISPPLAFVRAGHTGVSLFFVLSGFLLGREFFAEIGSGRVVDRRRYALRRALRILPLYYGVVVLATAINTGSPGDIVRGVPYLFFLNAFAVSLAAPIGAFSGVWWSLATEVQFYVALPLVAALLRPSRRRAGLALLGLYGIAYAAFVLGVARPRTLPDQQLLAHSLFGEGPLFLYGVAGAWLHERNGPRWRIAMAANSALRNGGGDLLLIAALVGLGVLLRTVVRTGPTFDLPPMQAWHLLEGLLWATVLLLLLDAPLRLRAALSNRFLAACGTISYSMYLLHVPVLAALRSSTGATLGAWNWQAGIWIAAFTVICFAVATASYLLIERPILALKTRL